MPGVADLGRDALRVFRERPAIAVGAGVVALLAVRFLSDDPGDEPAVEDPAAADPGYGGGLLGGGLGSLGPTYPSIPGGSDLPFVGDLPLDIPGLPSGPAIPLPTPTPTPTAPTTTPTPTPTAPTTSWWSGYGMPSAPPSGAQGIVIVSAGTYRWYNVSSGRITGYSTFTTRGFRAYYGARATYPWPAASSQRLLVRILNGGFAGRYFSPAQAGVRDIRR